MPRAAGVIRDRVLMSVAALLLAGAASARDADFAILIAVHLTAAEMNCPYRIEEGRLRRLLGRHGLALRDAYTATRSPQLGAEIDKVMESFRIDRDKACAAAWKHFGPGATFEGFLQPR